MLRHRFFTVVNLALVAVCFCCAWYLSRAHYVKPAEITNAGSVLQDDSKIAQLKPGENPAAPTPTPTPVATPVELAKDFLNPLYTPPPTPTPTPEPPPPPPNLESAVARWTVQALNKNKAVFMDGQTQEIITLTVGGPPHEAKDKDNRPVQVSLREVNLRGEAKAILAFEDQAKEMKMQM